MLDKKLVKTKLDAVDSTLSNLVELFYVDCLFLTKSSSLSSKKISSTLRCMGCVNRIKILRN